MKENETEKIWKENETEKACKENETEKACKENETEKLGKEMKQRCTKIKWNRDWIEGCIRNIFIFKKKKKYGSINILMPLQKHRTFYSWNEKR